MVNEIWQGDVLELAKRLPDNSVHMICTSPPYWSLRDYGIEGQLGLEPTPEEYIEKMVLIFRELRRALREDGTLWMNLGDSYNGSGGDHKRALPSDSFQGKNTYGVQPKYITSLKPKDLCGIPWRVALALQADGWYLRSDIIWSKPNPMPESVTDRPTKAHEYLFLLTKSPKYFYDAEAIREPHQDKERPNGPSGKAGIATGDSINQGWNGQGYKAIHKHNEYNPNGRNRRTVWEIATQPYPEAHFATYPEALVEPCILAGTSAYGVCGECGKPWERVVEITYTDAHKGMVGNQHKIITDNHIMQAGRENDKRMNKNTQTLSWQPTCKHTEQPIPAIVLDPFTGSGTTLSVAKRLGRRFLGFELNPDYIKLAWKRLDATQPPLIVENDIITPQVPQFEQLSF